MKNKKLLVFITMLIALTVIISGVIYLYSSPGGRADECRPIDRLQKNCIPAGTCYTSEKPTIVEPEGCFKANRGYDYTD